MRAMATFDLEAALRDAPPNARIAIPAGRFKLTRSIELKKDVTLVGKGAKKTILAGASDRALLVCSAKIELRDVGVVRKGGRGDVVLVTGGALTTDGVHLSGGKGKEQHGIG